jgi:predicted nucleic acid-binding protein
MKERSFFDTNILVYTDDSEEAIKAEKSIDLIEDAMRSNRGVLSTQILQEYFVATTRKLGLDPELAKQRVEFFSLMHTVQVTPEDIFSAINIYRLYHLSFWDALVIQAARKSNCNTILTEDLNHGQIIEGVKIINPFND